MHAIRVLREDHDRIEALLAEMDGTADGKSRTFERLEREISIHTLAEENIFLPQVEDAIEDSKKTTDEFFDDSASVLDEASELISASYRKHREIKNLLGEIQSSGEGDKKDKISDLRKTISAHVETEEDLFPLAERVLEEEDFERIGDLLEHCKWQVRGMAQASLASSSGFKPVREEQIR